MVRLSLCGVMLAGFLLVSVVPFQGAGASEQWWNTAWSFRQEVCIPFDTSLPLAAYQPIDTTLVFSSPCWAVDEQHHSVRIICQVGEKNLELESQLYDLVYSDATHVSSANLVFLIPPQADGSERYFVYYDETDTAQTTYPDHVSVEDASYFYEPFPGYPIHSQFFKISQEGYVQYAVTREGDLLTYRSSQYVTKAVNDTIDILPKNTDAGASFDFQYYYGDRMSEFSSTNQQLVSDEVLCDGTLMVSCKVVSRSTDSALQTTAVYKYYYSPSAQKRLYAHVVHEVLEECLVFPETSTDGTYAMLRCGGIHSSSIEDLNFGRMYPFIHAFSEHGSIDEYRVNMNPEFNPDDPVLRLIQTTDDVDGGDQAWMCFDKGTSGPVHALVLGSTSVLRQGDDERDGVQLKAFESNYPNLPGLDYVVATLQFTRNSYEKDTRVHDTVIPKGFVAEFDAEFFSSASGGYPVVEQEAAVFQSLVPLKPSVSDDHPSNGGEQDVERYSLTVSVHSAPSVPFGSLLSVLTGREIPYLNIEVYTREGVLLCSGTASRLSLKDVPTSGESSFREYVKMVLQLFDFRNVSVFKKIQFDNLEQGSFVVKVFLENVWWTQPRFIGYACVEVSEDTSVHIGCRPQGFCRVSVVDQEGQGISGAEVQLLDEGMVIAHNTTDDDGAVRLSAPCNLRQRYQLRVLYKGFEVRNESIRFGYGRRVVPLRATVDLSRYDWRLTLRDVWGLPVEVALSPRLSSREMSMPVVLPASQQSNDYVFTDLLSATYQLSIHYKSFSVEQDVNIPSSDGVVEFPAVFPVSLRVFDSRGLVVHGAGIEVSRGGKTLETTSSSDGVMVELPPGVYQVTVLDEGDVVARQRMTVSSERSLEMITTQEPLFPLVVLILAGCLLLLGGLLSVRQKTVSFFLVTLVLGGMMVAVVSPWWVLQGTSSGVQTSSVLYLLPLDLLTKTTAGEVLSGARGFIPDVFCSVVYGIGALSIGAGVLIVGSLLAQRRQKRRGQLASLGVAVVLLVGSLALFVVAMSAFTQVGVGSLSGEGTLTVSIPGEEVSEQVLCHWGPGIGCWIYTFSGVVLVLILCSSFFMKKGKNTV